MDLFRRIFGKPNEEPSVNESVVETPPLSREAGESQTTAEDLARTHPIAEGVTQPLNPDVVPPNPGEYVIFGQSTDIGLVRNNNQDSALSFFFTGNSIDKQPDFGLFIVADGMGGHHDGEHASAITTRIIASNIMSSVYLPLLKNTNGSLPPISDSLISAVQKANFEVLRGVPDGGTTVTAAVLVNDLIHIVHVGDSRAYVITPYSIEQITRDHSLVQRLIELEQLTREEAETHPQKNVLYRALGQSEALEVDTVTRRLPANSRLLICSDGLWGLVSEQDLFEISMNNPDPQQACDKLVALANTKGGNDNITVILLKVI